MKSVVVENVKRRGHAILNADDPMCQYIARHAGGETVWFSLNGGARLHGVLRDHVRRGGMALVREESPDGGVLVVHRGGERSVLMAAAEIPATLGGIAEFNIANALAAAAMTLAYGVDPAIVRKALAAFACSFEECPGRLNIDDRHGFRVILDYAHNPASLTALGQVIAKMRGGQGRVIGMVSIPGDRRDEDIIAMGRLAASIFDEIIFREAPDGRGRPQGQVNSLMSQGALAAGASADRVRRVVDEAAAADACLRMARPGDLVVLMPTAIDRVWRQVREFAPQCDWNAQVAAHG